MLFNGTYTVCPGSSDPFHIVTYYIKWGTTSWTYTVCPRSSDPFYIVTYYIKWVTTSWTYSTSWTDGKTRVSTQEFW